MKTRWRFSVEGPDPFPVDMLRYDACWPQGSDDVYEITASVDGARAHNPRRIVHLRSDLREPTEERWASFGWRVLGVEKVRL
jgi:hypothetical protein